MKAVAVLAIGLVLASTAALADTFYRYRDKSTGRDVFVNRLEQVPRQYRSQAKIVLENGALANQDEVKQEAPQIPGDEGLADKLIKDLAPASSSGGANPPYPPGPRRFLRDGPVIAVAAVVDAKLGKAGSKLLTREERAQLVRFLTIAIYLGMAAGLCAFVVWVVLVACAFRDKRPGWGALMIALVPLAYPYLLLHFGKDRPALKTACGLGLLSPALVGLWAAWRFYDWFHLVVRARGGHL